MGGAAPTGKDPAGWLLLVLGKRMDAGEGGAGVW